jgi:hypothetical protein
MENNLASLLRDFAQGASNSAATNLSVPVDALAWLLRKGGMNIPNNPVGGSDWMAEKGLTPQPKNKLAGLLGDVAGFAAPLAAVTKATQIARGLLAAGEAMPMGSKGMPALSKASPMADRGAIVWHGSPHKFDAFDASKIGTGEGAQAYGHGLYLADSPDVANMYRNNLAGVEYAPTETLKQYFKEGNIVKSYGGQDKVLGFTSNPDGTWQTTVQAVSKDKDGNFVFKAGSKPRSHSTYPDLNEIKKIGLPTAQPGSTYKVDLPDEHIVKMLDWDKPLSQQQDIAKMLNKNSGLDMTGEELINEMRRNPSQYFDKALSGKDLTGAYINPHAGASEVLRQQGIPGIKYLDGGSRTAGQGSSNYVVFPGNERLLKILERNGQTP